MTSTALLLSIATHPFQIVLAVAAVVHAVRGTLAGSFERRTRVAPNKTPRHAA